MATKAGRIHLGDIKQGRVFYQVVADFNYDGTPKIVSVKPIYVTSRPKEMNLYTDMVKLYRGKRQNRNMALCGRRPEEKHHNQFAAEYGRMRDVVINLDRIFKTYASEEITEKGLYNPVFINKRAADRFIKAFMLRRATEKEMERVKDRQKMGGQDFGPRGHISDADVSLFKRPINEPYVSQPMESFTPPPKLKCECGQERQYPFYLGVVCNLCNTKFEMRGAVPAPEPLDWDNLRENVDGHCGLPHMTLAAELPKERDYFGIWEPNPLALPPMPTLPPIDPEKLAEMKKMWDKMRQLANDLTLVRIKYQDLTPEQKAMVRQVSFDDISLSRGVEPMRGLSIIRGKRRNLTDNVKPVVSSVTNWLMQELEPKEGEFNIRTAGEIDIPFPPENTGSKLSYYGVGLGMELNLSMMKVPEPQEDPTYDALYAEMRRRLPKVTYHIESEKPLNLYGDEHNFKPFPDISTLPQDENGLILMPGSGSQGTKLTDMFGGRGVVVRIDEDIPLEDSHGNRIPDFIFEPAMPNQAVLDYMSGKISLEECELRTAETNRRVAAMTSEFVDNNPKNEWDPSLDGMALFAIESGVITEDQYTLIRCRDDSTGFITAFREYVKKGPRASYQPVGGPADFMSNFAAANLSGDWYITVRDKQRRSGRIIDKEEYERRMADNQPTEE